MNRPRITFMGEEVPYDDVPGTGAIDYTVYYKPVRITLDAVNEASKLVPADAWKSKNMGLCRWLELASQAALKNLPIDKMEVKHYALIYSFQFDGDQPVLTKVRLG